MGGVCCPHESNGGEFFLVYPSFFLSSSFIAISKAVDVGTTSRGIGELCAGVVCSVPSGFQHEIRF